MDIFGKIKFAKRDAKWSREKAFTLLYQPPPGHPKTNIEHEEVDVVIHDVRPYKELLNLDREGYQIIDLESKLQYEDFFNRDRVKDIFAVELRDVLLKLLGARGVYFHETVV
jgi:hypothetical protein